MSDQSIAKPITFTDRDLQLCPFPAYDKLREESPVYQDPVTGNFILTKFADVRKVLLNTAIFSSKAGILGDRWTPEVNQLFESKGWLPVDTLVACDPPEHRFYRSLVDKVFTTKKVLELEPRMTEIVNGLIDGFIDSDEVNFIDVFAIPLPMVLIAEQLGIDQADKGKFKIWSDAALESTNPDLPPERQVELASHIIALQHYMSERIDRARAEPDDKLLSQLVNFKNDNDKALNKQELLNVIQQILVAGNDTTTTALGNGMRALIDRSDLAEEIYRNPERAQPFVEEILRSFSPVQTLFRRVTADTELGGVSIPAGSMVEVRYGAANRDPSQFSCPADLDLDRRNITGHMAFGTGVHMCIGNQLARSELRISFQALTRRLANIRASRGEESFSRVQAYLSYGLDQLWTAFDAR